MTIKSTNEIYEKLVSRMQEVIQECTSCGLHKYRRNVVVGRGVIPADMVFVGEAPGKTEDLRGNAFVGRAGELLEDIIYEACKRLAMKRPKVLFMNTVCCRPTNEVGGANRQPTPEERLACAKNFNDIINMANPKHIVLVGKVARDAYKKTFPFASTILHPAYLLRQGGSASPDYIDTVRVVEGALTCL